MANRSRSGGHHSPDPAAGDVMALCLAAAGADDWFVAGADDLVRAGCPVRIPDQVLKNRLVWALDNSAPVTNSHLSFLAILGSGRAYAAELAHEAVVYGRADGGALAVEVVRGQGGAEQTVELIDSNAAVDWMAERIEAWHWIGLAIDLHIAVPWSADDAIDPARVPIQFKGANDERAA